MNIIKLLFSAAPLIALLTACSTTSTKSNFEIEPSGKYVAMGSSFAAGPGITTTAKGSSRRCGRSADNYAHQLAARYNLDLVDVTCSGAKTDDILSTSNGLPAQLEAVDPETKLVTITIGGNDLGYIGGLMVASCEYHSTVSSNFGSQKCWPAPKLPRQSDYQNLEDKMTKIAKEVRRKAPGAILVFVDYQTVLPENELCDATPLSPEAARSARQIADKLERITHRVAANNNARTVKASALTKRHHACSKSPWMRGYAEPDFTFPSIPYHPSLESMTAIADALENTLKASP